MFENGGCKVGRRDIFTGGEFFSLAKTNERFDSQFSRYLRVDVKREQESHVVMHRFYSDASLDVDASCNNLLHEVSILFLKRMDV